MNKTCLKTIRARWVEPNDAGFQKQASQNCMAKPSFFWRGSTLRALIGKFFYSWKENQHPA
jgi:hypothetical protein